MFNKTFIISILALLISVVFVVEATARCGVCRRSPLGLCVDQVLKGLGNVEKNAVFSEVTLEPKVLKIKSWCNRGDGCGGQGTPFSFDYPADNPLNSLAKLDAKMITNGSGYVEHYYPGCFLWEALFCKTELDYKDKNDENFCIQYQCEKYDNEGKCLEWNDNCLYEGGRCTSEYDFSWIPDEAYPNGNTNWQIEPPYCNPKAQPLLSTEFDGDVFIEVLWLTSLKTVYDCPEGSIPPDGDRCEPIEKKTDIYTDACLYIDLSGYDLDNLTQDDINTMIYQEAEGVGYDQCTRANVLP